MGGDELKWCQLTPNQLISPQGPHFSPHSAAKINDKSTHLRKNGIYWYSDVVTASVYWDKTRVKKLMKIIIIMNKSQEITVFLGHQKLTSAMKLRLKR